MADESTAPGRKQMWAIWVAIVTMLTSTVAPKVIEMLDDRPSTAQVQELIAKQTDQLTQTVNKLVELTEDVKDRLARLEGRVEGLRTMPLGALPLPAPAPVMDTSAVVRAVKAFLAKDEDQDEPSMMVMSDEPAMAPAPKLKKVPEVNLMQQIQQAVPEKDGAK